MADDPIIESLNPFPEREGETDREARIRQRAYDRWIAEGSPVGREQDHWFAAEREFLLAEPEHSLGTPIVPSEAVPEIRTAGVPAESYDGTAHDPFEKPVAPKTSGASTPEPDTSKSPIANRDIDGPRKAGATPRPTEKPLG